MIDNLKAYKSLTSSCEDDLYRILKCLATARTSVGAFSQNSLSSAATIGTRGITLLLT